MIGQKLYMAVWVNGSEPEPLAAWERELLGVGPDPAGWREYALERWPDGPREHEVWPNGHKPFFWPKTDVPYKSRSSAQARVDIINRWGGNAVVVECTPQWETVEAANQRRERERLKVRIERKRAELERLEDEWGFGATISDLQSSFS